MCRKPVERRIVFFLAGKIPSLYIDKMRFSSCKNERERVNISIASMPQNFSLRTPDPIREQIMQEITQIAMIAMLRMESHIM